MLKVSIQNFAYDKREILHNIHFSIEKGEHLAVLGESGCGKSTLLHIIYGLLHLENGTIFWDEKELLGPKFNLIPGEDFIKLVAQEFNVMPYISVAENIATHLSRLDMEADKKRVDELLNVVEMNSFANAMVKNLSGGQKQRVALAKALAKEPKLILLDEPFSNIDTFRKNTLRRKLFNYLKENNISCITATHDAEEALAFSDTLLLLKEGSIDKIGPPQEIYTSLDSLYQAGFFGEVSVLEKGMLSSEKIFLLPSQLMVSTTKTKLEVTVVKNYFKGSHYLVEAVSNTNTIFFENRDVLKEGTSVFLKLVNS